MSSRVIVLAIAGLLLACVAGGVFADRWTRAHVSPDARAEEMKRAGKLEGAERLYWSLLQEGPVTVPLLVSFLDAHARAIDAATHPGKDDDGEGLGPRGGLVADGPAIDEPTIDAFLARSDLPPGVPLLGRYWRSVRSDDLDRDLEREVTRAADAEPPAPWTNHLLAQAALHSARVDDAAERLLREGTYFHERAADANLALELWGDREAWERVDRALADPRVAFIAHPWVRLLSAIRLHDWLTALRVFPRCLRSPMTAGTLLLAGIAALAWGTFCARLGGVGARPSFRLPLYLAAFVLGVASVSLTLAFVALEETLLKMSETGNPLRDALYFTFGVGFREEFSKLLFFTPLLPILHRKGTRLDVLVCGALVGLGFAAEENLGYLASGDLSTAMGRFLTANFLHMSMTAILASALDEMVKDGEEGSMRFSLALLRVAALHGAYDFFLSSRTYGNLSYFAMGVFFFLSREFLTLVSWARAKERAPRPHLLETFAFAMAVVVGGSFVYASALVGPAAAAAALAEGLIGLGIIVVLFVQELRRV